MSPFSSIVRAVLAIAVIGLSVSMAAAIVTTLQGWGNYKFGMTPDQIRALPGTSWSELKSLTDGALQYMNALTAIKIEGHDFRVGVYFDPDKKLNSINFTEV